MLPLNRLSKTNVWWIPGTDGWRFVTFPWTCPSLKPHRYRNRWDSSFQKLPTGWHQSDEGTTVWPC